MRSLTLAIEDVVLEKARPQPPNNGPPSNAAVRQFLMEFEARKTGLPNRRSACADSWTSRQAVSARISNRDRDAFMTIECFLDTDILVYAAIGKRDEPAKFAGARDLLLDLSFERLGAPVFLYRGS